MSAGLIPVGLVLALSVALPAHAGRIDGLDPAQPITAEPATVHVTGQLRITLTQQRVITVAPWPRFLPQHFGPQTLSATRDLNPAGSIDRLELTRQSEAQAWLLIGDGTRNGARLLGNWRLQLSDGAWRLTDDHQQTVLLRNEPRPAPVLVADRQQRWCIHLLESSLPQLSPANIASEQEPQVMWVAVRLPSQQKRCPASAVR